MTDDYFDGFLSSGARESIGARSRQFSGADCYLTGAIGRAFLVGLPIALSVKRFAGATGDVMGAAMDSTL